MTIVRTVFAMMALGLGFAAVKLYDAYTATTGEETSFVVRVLVFGTIITIYLLRLINDNLYSSIEAIVIIGSGVASILVIALAIISSDGFDALRATLS
jgi:hypothetical protein